MQTIRKLIAATSIAIITAKISTSDITTYATTVKLPELLHMTLL